MKEKCALIVLDIQTGLLKEIAEADTLIRNVNMLIDAFHEMNLPVCFIRHTKKFRLKEGSPDWQIAAALHKQDSDKTVNKHQLNAFKSRQMQSFIREEGICIAAVTGLMTQACIQKTCLGAMRQGLGTVLIADAHRTTAKHQETVIDKWNGRLARKGVAVISTEAFLAELQMTDSH